jgi:UDPglucose 6-dehydrogenase
VIIDSILKAGGKVKAYDPVSMHEAEKTLGNSITYSKDEYEALIDADALLLVTEWPEFRSPNYVVMGKLMKSKVIFDGRNVYDIAEMKELGYDYHCIGIKTN